MRAIINFLEGIGEIIHSVIQFIISFFSDLIWIVNTLIWAVGQIPRLLSWIPGEIQAIILITLSVVMIYKIMGREG